MSARRKGTRSRIRAVVGRDQREISARRMATLDRVRVDLEPPTRTEAKTACGEPAVVGDDSRIDCSGNITPMALQLVHPSAQPRRIHSRYPAVLSWTLRGDSSDLPFCSESKPSPSEVFLGGGQTGC